MCKFVLATLLVAVVVASLQNFVAVTVKFAAPIGAVQDSNIVHSILVVGCFVSPAAVAVDACIVAVVLDRQKLVGVCRLLVV